MFPPLEYFFFDHQDQDTLQNDYPGNRVSEKTSSEIVLKVSNAPTT